MSYAIRKDGKSWRAVNSKSDCTKEETFSEVQPDPIQPDLVEMAVQQRESAYREESDPIFFKAQRGEATMDEWKAKVAEIKARFPKE